MTGVSGWRSSPRNGPSRIPRADSPGRSKKPIGGRRTEVGSGWGTVSCGYQYAFSTQSHSVGTCREVSSCIRNAASELPG